jgi:hypothetical protein
VRDPCALFAGGAGLAARAGHGFWSCRFEVSFVLFATTLA